MNTLDLDACPTEHPAIKSAPISKRAFYSTKRPHYLPTPTEISRQCELIRRTWSETERRRRKFFIVNDRRRVRKPVDVVESQQRIQALIESEAAAELNLST